MRMLSYRVNGGDKGMSAVCSLHLVKERIHLQGKASQGKAGTRLNVDG